MKFQSRNEVQIKLGRELIRYCQDLPARLVFGPDSRAPDPGEVQQMALGALLTAVGWQASSLEGVDPAGDEARLMIEELCTVIQRHMPGAVQAFGTVRDCFGENN